MLDLAGVSSRYGRIPALAGFDLHVGNGELVALVGANGAGKTTVLRTISGVQPLSGGVIRFEGNDLAQLSPRRRVQLGVVQVPEGRQIFAPLSVEDNLRLGAFARGSPRQLATVLAMFPALEQKRRDAAGTLSGGQQQMLAIGRAMMASPRLLLLDEPSMGLAPRFVAEVFTLIARLKGQGMTILLVDQNAHAALAVADRGYVMEAGRVSLCGVARDLLCDHQVRQAYLGA